MSQSIATIALLVREYDEALTYYTGMLGFEVVEDTKINDGKRWIMVRPPHATSGCALLLAKASNPGQSHSIGNQAGGRVFLFLETNNFDDDYRTYRARGVRFQEEPRHEAYGRVVVFEDIYGNRWDLLERQK